MTAAFLQSELAGLISDSKRKHIDVRSSAEKSLAELRSISVTSETQLAGDLVRKTSFIDPFLLACKSQNTKLASNGTACLQRLVASTAVPRSRLPDLLQAFEEAVPLALEVQLKILQTLPSLLQLYATDLHGEALSRTLSVSADLSGNKLPMVSGTASATFQQLLTAVFVKANTKTAERSQSDPRSDHSQDKEDAFAIFVDLCALLSGHDLEFVRLEKLPPVLVLEAVESLLSAHGSFIMRDHDTRKACAELLLPGLQTLIENSASYPVVARAIRIAFILTTQHLSQLKLSLMSLLNLILKITDRGGSHKWKRVLCVEFCRGICSDFESLRRNFATYDLAAEGMHFVSDLMASLVRITSEDPAMIGLGRQSTIPTAVTVDSYGENTSATELPAAIGNVGQAEAAAIGLSVQKSTVQVSCLDQYDRSVPPEIPDTYIFTLVLSSISAFSDGLSKLIMPLSVPDRRTMATDIEERGDSDANQSQRKGSIRDVQDAQKYQRLVNPLTRKDSNKFSSVQECAKMVESCWPAILAVCSTFLNAALDSYFYHMLIRTVQKLTQVSGVLELITPRDALLTLLAKVSVPANVSGLMNAFYGGQSVYQAEQDEQDAEDLNAKSPIANTPRQSIDLSSQTLNVRNLLCLRALLNLGIALGPTLSNSAWTILWQSLQQVEALMSVSPANKAIQNSALTGGDAISATTLASETSAVDTARRRMIESSTAYSDAAFEVVCRSLFGMIEDVIPAPSDRRDSVPNANGALQPRGSHHHSSRSISGSWAKTTTFEVEVQFVLKSIGRLASVNLHRFRRSSSSSVSWRLVVATLSLLQSNQKLQTHLRLQCANIIDGIVVESCNNPEDDEIQDHEIHDSETVGFVIQNYSITALGKQISDVQYHTSSLQKPSDVEVQTILLALQALHNVISSVGDDLQSGWNQIFETLKSITSHHALELAPKTFDSSASQAESIAKIYTAAFKVTHLISADFLSSLNDDALANLLTLFEIFGSQKFDLNMSLTTTALYWNICGLVSERLSLLSPFVEISAPGSNNTEAVGDRDENLWHATILGLQRHCKDDRGDTRNAALRMLAKIIETLLPQMSSKTINSYNTLVSLPLIDYYAKQDMKLGSSWSDSALQVLQDIARQVQSNSTLVMQDDSFQDFWVHLNASSSQLLHTQDMQVVTATFKALSELVDALLHSSDSSRFSNSEVLFKACWDLWTANDPTDMETSSHNQNAYAAYARFVVVMAAWNLRNLSQLERPSQRVSKTIDRIIFGGTHDNYTVDVNKLSVEQEQALQVLDILKQIFSDDENTHVFHLLSLANNLLARTLSLAGTESSTRAINGSRQPTGIAFATACVGKLSAMLRLRSESRVSFADYPFHTVLQSCAKFIRTKYSGVPTNQQLPLWRQATLLATECTSVIAKQCNDGFDLPDIEAVSSAIHDTLAAILEAPHLDNRAADARPSTEMIRSDEQFDVEQLNSFHTGAHTFLFAQDVPQPLQKQYILTLFNHSLVAKLWYNDLPTNLAKDPLQNFTKIRPGSIRAPQIFIRQHIATKALECLFSLVSSTADSSGISNSRKTMTTPSSLSTLASPYILLRLSHTLKSFLADQPLRYLQHPHLILQRDLHIVLRTFLDLRVSDDSFGPAVSHLGLNPSTVGNDGKTHLRIMTGLVERFEVLWRELPRLERGLAWQDYEDGRGVERCLREWRKCLSEGRTVRFE